MRRPALVVVPLAVLVGCATADKKTLVSGQPDGGLHPTDDGGSNEPPPDAFELADAPPNQQQKTLDQNASDALAAGTSAICPDAANDDGSGESHYYRIFDLAAEGVTRDFNISGVTFQVEDAFAISTQSVTINVGTFSGAMGGNTFELSALSAPLGTATSVVPDVDENRNTTPPTTPGATVTAPLAATIPAGSKLYVEIASPDGTGDHYLYLGANTSGERNPGYLHAPNCTDKPTSFASLTQTLSSPRSAALLVTVTGTY